MKTLFRIFLIFILIFSFSNLGAQYSEEDILAIPKETKNGKICFALYTVSNNILKLTAQFYPLTDDEDFKASLEIKGDTGWTKIDEQGIQYPGLIANFRIENWDDTKQYEYRINHNNTSFFTGTIQKNPTAKDVLTVFAFTGNSAWRKIDDKYVVDDKSDIVENIKKAKPDLLFFSGDQVYNHANHYRAWLKFGRDYGEVIKDIPTICLPDDHDVGQWNLWGAGGKKSLSRNGTDGGYFMPAEYVKEVERAQTSHLPDPYDPRPIEQGLGVYYTNLNWGGVDFAIIEDRKFKSGPEQVLPKHQPRSDHYATNDYDPAALDAPGAKLLGDRQLKFLEEWGKNWTNTEMKAVLSQTIFACASNIGDSDGRVYADLDANGWPQTGRNKALSEIRKSFAVMIAGDQHLATVLHHGIDNWNDAGYSFCVPSIANYYLRWWNPDVAGENRKQGQSEIYGEFKDGFGNKMTMRAVANPDEGNNPYNRGEGFGVIKFDKKNRETIFECWPRNVDISLPETNQYNGWPIIVDQTDNYKINNGFYLPKLKINKSDEVVQIIKEDNNEVVFTLRIKGHSFQPQVDKAGNYTIIIGEGDFKYRFEGIEASRKITSKEIIIK